MAARSITANVAPSDLAWDNVFKPASGRLHRPRYGSLMTRNTLSMVIMSPIEDGKTCNSFSAT